MEHWNRLARETVFLGHLKPPGHHPGQPAVGVPA